MDKKILKELEDIIIQTETFLTEYANGVYGKQIEHINVTKDVVRKFMKKSSKEDMEEILSYLKYKDEMIKRKNIDGGGASDLEDFISQIVTGTDDL